jgi:hypothetical protein
MILPIILLAIIILCIIKAVPNNIESYLYERNFKEMA